MTDTRTVAEKAHGLALTRLHHPGALPVRRPGRGTKKKAKPRKPAKPGPDKTVLVTIPAKMALTVIVGTDSKGNITKAKDVQFASLEYGGHISTESACPFFGLDRKVGLVKAALAASKKRAK